MTRRLVPVLLAVLTAGAVLASPSLAAEPTTDAGPVGLRALDLPDVPAAVKLECRGRSSDAGAAVSCGWRGGTDAAIRTWQLWNLQVRPSHGPRNLVAEVGADTHRYTDTEVEVPAAYLYAVLGLNGDGEVVARSRVVYVRLADRTDGLEKLDLGCTAVRGEGISDETTVRDDVQVGCVWRPSENRRTAGYVLWRGVDGGARDVIARVGADVTAYRDRHVAPGHRYAYVVQAVDAEGHVVGTSRPAVLSLRPHDEPERDRPTDVRPDTVTDRATDRATDVRPDTVTDRATDTATDRATDVRPDTVTDRATDTATDRATDVRPDTVADRATDTATDRATDVRPTDHTDRTDETDHSADHADHTDRPVDVVVD